MNNILSIRLKNPLKIFLGPERKLKAVASQYLEVAFLKVQIFQNLLFSETDPKKY